MEFKNICALSVRQVNKKKKQKYFNLKNKWLKYC